MDETTVFHDEDKWIKAAIEHTNNGYVYALVCGEKIKIGKSKSYRKRIKSYKPISNNFRVIGLIKTNNHHQLETDLLEYFGGKAYKREWLEYSEQLEIAVHNKMQELVGYHYV